MSHPQRWMSAGGSSQEPNAPAIYVLPPQSTMVRFDTFLVRWQFSKQFEAKTVYRISSYSCRGNYSFLNSSSEETIQVFISLM